MELFLTRFPTVLILAAYISWLIRSLSSHTEGAGFLTGTKNIFPDSTSNTRRVYVPGGPTLMLTADTSCRCGQGTPTEDVEMKDAMRNKGGRGDRPKLAAGST